ncbi:MAG: hypothetical protein DI585_05900 [Pseudomonas fluorescens]|nr:MAG: hypothetical protein DI585_05900 [Pseudomonas fluorescens]
MSAVAMKLPSPVETSVMFDLKQKEHYYLELMLDFIEHDQRPRPYRSDIVAVVNELLRDCEFLSGFQVEAVNDGEGVDTPIVNVLVSLVQTNLEEAAHVGQQLHHGLSALAKNQPNWLVLVGMKLVMPPLRPL